MITVWSPTYQQIIFKHYHSDKHLSEFYLQDGGKINWHRYGTIITSLSRQVCSSYSIALHIYFRATRQPLPPKKLRAGHTHVIVSAFYRRKPWLRHCVIDLLMLRRQLRFRMLMCVIFAASACCQCELEDLPTVMLRAYKVGQYNSEPLLDCQQIVLNVCK